MKPTLLIVDDIEAVREKLREALQDGFDVVAMASSGPEAVSMCEQHLPQLVLMDLVMPNMSGIDATRAILDKVTPPPCVVVLSALHDENVVLRALEVGAAEFLVKPISEAKIREVLHALASERSRQAA